MSSPRRSTHRCACALALALLGGFLPCGDGIAAEPTEYDVKAAFLLNIAKYGDWPAQAFASAAAPIVIGVLGDDPFGASLDRIVQGRVVNGRPVAVRRSKRLADMRGSHVVFIGASESDRAASICASLAEGGSLSVGDAHELASFTAIQFSIESGKIAFSVNLAAVHKSGPSISSKLLRLAKSVLGTPVAEKTTP